MTIDIKFLITLIHKGYDNIIPFRIMVFKIYTLKYKYYLNMGFKDNLEFALDSAGLKHVDLAEKTGISIKTIENYFKESKPVIPMVDKAVKIAQEIGVTVEYLVNGNEGKKNDTADIQLKNREFFNTLAKLDKYNFDIITSMAKTLLQSQDRKKQ